MHDGLHISVEACCRPALVFANVREDGRRRGDGQRRKMLREPFDRRVLVPRVDVRMQEAHRDRLDALLVYGATQSRQRRVELEHRLLAAIVAHAPADLEAQRARHHGRRELQAQVEQVVAPLHRDLEHVAEAAVDQHRGPRALALDDGVGDERRAMGYDADITQVDPRLGDAASPRPRRRPATGRPAS